MFFLRPPPPPRSALSPYATLVRSSGKVIISAKSGEVGDNEDEVESEAIEGGEGKIAFNSRYLLDVLSVLEKGKVALETTTSSSPGVFKPTDSEDYIHVVMPMFVQW